MEKLNFVTDIAIMLMKNYMDKFYKYEKSKWEVPLLEYQDFVLKPSEGNFVKEYKISYLAARPSDSISEMLKTFVEEIKGLLEDHKGIPDYEKGVLSNHLIIFDFPYHLYTPLVCQKQAAGKNLTVSPVSLNEDEKRFVDKLHEYVTANPSMFTGNNVHLLRNKSKAGLGFFEAGNFYPDFILWIDTPDGQYISFVDPKGLLRVQWNDPKIEFYKTIKELEARLEPTSAGKKIVLNSFIMSATPSAELRQWWGKSTPERRAKNVFCLDEDDCIEGMIAKIFAV